MQLPPWTSLIVPTPMQCLWFFVFNEFCVPGVFIVLASCLVSSVPLHAAFLVFSESCVFCRVPCDCCVASLCLVSSLSLVCSLWSNVNEFLVYSTAKVSYNKPEQDVH